MKVVNLKQAILQAWKERWSDYQWAINIKKNFPKGATWDYPNLAGMSTYDFSTFKLLFVSYCIFKSDRKLYLLTAEALMEQAMIGLSPNPLILSYLKYAVSSQVRKKIWEQCDGVLHNNS